MVRLNKNSAKLLKLFYSHPQEAFYIQQIGRILHKKPGVFQRTLYKMEKEGVLRSEYKANARFFRANTTYPIYKELKSIIFKSGIALSIFIMFLIPFFYTGEGFCQEVKSGTVELFSLEQTINIAYKNNKSVQIQEQEVKVAEANILGAKSLFLPNVDFNASYTRTGAILKSTAHDPKKDTGVFTGYKNDNNVGVSVNESIYNGGANIANLREVELQFKEQQESLRETKLNVEFETKRLYHGLLLAYETKRIAEDLVAQAQSHYEEVRKKFEQGTASKFDALQSKVQISLLIPQLINALNSIDLIMAELNKLLSLNIQQTINVRDKLDYSQIEIEEGVFLKEAYLNNPRMILRSLGVDISKWAIRFAKSGWFPQVSSSAEYNFRSNNVSNMFNNRHSNWNIGVAVTIPIFDGFATKAKVDAAKAKYLESILSKEDTRDQVAVDIRQACLDLKQAQAVIDAQRDNLEDAREALKISEVRFDNGVGINLDVLDAQVSLAQVQQNLAQGIYDYIMAKASLDRAMGKEFLKEAKYEKKN